LTLLSAPVRRVAR